MSRAAFELPKALYYIGIGQISYTHPPTFKDSINITFNEISPVYFEIGAFKFTNSSDL